MMMGVLDAYAWRSSRVTSAHPGQASQSSTTRSGLALWAAAARFAIEAVSTENRRAQIVARDWTILGSSSTTRMVFILMLAETQHQLVSG